MLQFQVDPEHEAYGIDLVRCNMFRIDGFVLEKLDQARNQTTFHDGYIWARQMDKFIEGLRSSRFITMELNNRDIQLDDTKSIHNSTYYRICDLLLDYQMAAIKFRRCRFLIHHLYFIPDSGINQKLKHRKIFELGQRSIEAKTEVLTIWNKILPILIQIDNGNTGNDSGVETHF